MHPRGRGNVPQRFGQRHVPMGPQRGGYNAPSEAPRGRGGYSANSSLSAYNAYANVNANVYNSGNGSAHDYANVTANTGSNANANNGEYRLKLDVKYYLRPRDCVDKLEIPLDSGISRKDTTCLPCGQTNVFGHAYYHLLRDGSSPRRCRHCGTMNHQGYLCGRLWLSAAFLKRACPGDGMRRPPQTRPSPLDLELILRDYPMHREFAESVQPLADKNNLPVQELPKHARPDDDEQPELKRTRTDTGGAEMAKIRADMNTLRAENERLKAGTERLRNA